MSILPSPYNTDYPDDNINLNLSDLDTLFTFTNLATMSGGLNMNSHKIMTVLDPTDLQDAATKNYVDTSVAQSNINGMNFKWYISNGAVLNSPTSVTCNQALHQFISSRYTYPLYNNKWQMTFTFPSLTGLPPSVPDDMQPPPTVGNFLLIGTQQVNFYLFNNSNAGNVSYFRLSAFNNLPIDQPFTVGDFVCILFDGIDSVLITINGTLLGRYISESPFYNAGNSILDGPVAGYYAGSTDVNTTVDNITWTMAGVYDTRQSYTQGLDFTWVLGLNSLLNTPTSITCKNAAGSFGTSLENFPLYKNKYTLSCKLPDVSTLPTMVLLTPDYANAFYIGGSTYGWIVLFNVSGINYFSIQYNIDDPLDPHPYTYGHMISIMFNGINSFSVNYAGTIYKTTVPYFNSNSYEKIRIGFRLGTTFIPITCTSISWSLNGIYDEISGAYLPLSGGTMTGVIDMGSNNITGTGTVAAGTFDVGGNVLITSPDSTTLQINNNLLPSSTTTHNLGSISKRWNNIYTNTLDTGTGVSIIVNGTITGDVQPTSINGGRLGQSTLPWLSSEITTENTKNLKIWNSTRLYNTTITSSNTSNTTIVLPVASGNSNSILINDGAGSTSWTTNYLQLSGGLMTGVIDMGNHKIIELTDPTNDQDAATKKYVDTQSEPTTQGLDFTWVLGANTTLNSPTSITCLHTSGAYGSSFRTYMFAKDSWSIECSLPDVSTLPLTNPDDPNFFDNVFYIGTTSTNVSNTGAGIICYNSTEGEGGIRFALIDYHSGNISNSTTYEAGLLITIVYDGINVMYVNYKGYMFSLPLATFGFTLFNLFIGFDTIITATNVPIICDYVLWSYLGQYYMGGTGTPMLVVNGKPVLTENGGTLIGNLHAPYMYSDKFIVNGGTNQQYLLADGTVALSSLIGSNIYYYKRNATSTPLPSPTSGYISFNNIVQESATFVYINDITDDSVDISPFLNLISVGNFLYIQDRNDSANYINFTVVLKNNITGGVEISVTFLNGAGSGLTNFGINNPVYFSIFSGTSDVGTRVNTSETKTQNQTAVSGTTTFSGALNSDTLSAGATTLSGNLAMGANAITSTGLLSAGATTLSGTLAMGANAITSTGLLSAGATTLSGTLAMGANAITSTGLLSAGATTLSGNLAMGANAITSTGLLSAGATTLSGTLAMGANAITSTGLLSAGATTLSGTLAPNVSSSGLLNIGSTSALWNNVYTKSIPLYNASSTFATTITSAATSSYPLILPTTSGTTSNILMLSNTIGQTTWSSNYVPLSGNTGNPMTGNLTVGTNTFTAGPSTVGTLSVGATTISGDLVPANSVSGQLNLGLSSSPWNTAHINTLTTGAGVAISITSNGTITGHILPTLSNTYDLGTSSLAFKSTESITNNTTNLQIRNGSVNGHLITSGSTVLNLPLILPTVQGSTLNILMLSNGTGQTTWSSNYVPLSGNTGNPMTGNLTVGTNTFTAGASTVGTLSAGATTLSGNLLPTSTISVLNIGSSGAVWSNAHIRSLLVYSAAGATATTILASPSQAFNSSLTLPPLQIVAGILYNDGTGVTNWTGNIGSVNITSTGFLSIGQISTAGVISPSVTSTIDIGSLSLSFRHLYLSGVANVGSVLLGTNTTISSPSISSAIVNNNWLPSASLTYSLGSVSSIWNNTVSKTISVYNTSTSGTNITTAVGGSSVIPLILPATQGLSNSVLTNDGVGNTSWVVSTNNNSITNVINVQSNLQTKVKNTINYTNNKTTTITTDDVVATLDTESLNQQIITFGKSIQNRWVAVGSGTNTIAYSNNGINWIGLGTPIFTTTGFAVAYNGYMWVAVGQGTNTIAYSFNGINWIGLGASIITGAAYGVAWNGTMWVAGGSGTNNMAYSNDGINWTGLGFIPFSSQCSGIAWNGTIWVAVGSGINTIAWSNDGINWTGIAASVTTFATIGRAVTWNGTQFVALGEGTNNRLTSYNGKTWVFGVTSIFVSGYGIAWSGTRYVAASLTTNTLAYSGDGITWVGSGTTIFATQGYGVDWGGNRFIAVGSGTNTIAWSNDGITWTGLGSTIFTLSGRGVACNSTRENKITFPSKLTVAIGSAANSIVYTTGNLLTDTWTPVVGNIFGTVSSGTGRGIAWNGNLWVAVGSVSGTTVGRNSIAYSYNGLTWTGLGINIFSTAGYGISWNGSIWVAVGAGTNSIAWSYDGITWTGLGLGIFTSDGQGIAWNGNLWVAVGSGTNSIAYSSNGINWTGIASGSTNFLTRGQGVSWNGYMWVAVGGGTNSILYSYNGINWNITTNVFTTQGNGVAWNGLLWVAVGAGTSCVAYSSNGINWTSIPAGVTTFTTSGQGITWNGSYWVAVGQGTNGIITSAAGITWTVFTLVNSLSGGGFGVACTQNLGSTYIQQPTIALGSGTNTLVYSADGYNYTGLGTTIFSTKGCAGVWNGSMWVAGGSGTNTFAYSYDGIKWTGLGSSIITTSVNAIAWNGSLWVAVGSGTNTIAWSNDGLTWNASTTINPFSGQGNGIAWSGTRWVAVGQGTINTIFYSNDGKTWTPATSNPFIGAVGTTVIWTGAKFLAGGNLSTNTFAYSSDGITWTAGGATVATSLNGLACNGKLCVAVGASTPAYSTNDGITWTLSTTTPFTGSSSGVAWNGRLFIMAGQGTNTLAISGSGIKWTVVPNSSTIFTTSGIGVAVNNPLYLNIPSSLILQPSSNINNNKIDVVTDAYNNGWLDLSCSVSSKTV